MAEDNKDDHTNWQENSARPSNFNRKDSDLVRDGKGNLKIKRDKQGLSEEENESIRETLDSLTEDDKREEE